MAGTEKKKEEQPRAILSTVFNTFITNNLTEYTKRKYTGKVRFVNDVKSTDDIVTVTLVNGVETARVTEPKV